MTRPTRTHRNRGTLPDLTDAQIDDLEAQNGLLQFDRMDELIEQAVSPGSFALTAEVICELQGIAVQGLEEASGVMRQEPISIGGSAHVPPAWQDTDRYVAAMCDYVNQNWQTATAEHLAAYVMWRLNWIHPFTNGNGRTSRVVAYLVYCAKLGFNLPGDRTIPEIIDQDKQAYYRALDDADRYWKERDEGRPVAEQINVTMMEQVILEALNVQLSEVEAGTGGEADVGLLEDAESVESSQKSN